MSLSPSREGGTFISHKEEMTTAKALFGCLIRSYVRVSERLWKPLVSPTELWGAQQNSSALTGRLEGADNPSWSNFLPAASAGEDLSLAVGIPASWAELNCGVSKAVNRFHQLFDDYTTIRTGTCPNGWCARLLDCHGSSVLYSTVHVDCKLPT